jgi:hypothetical protein
MDLSDVVLKQAGTWIGEIEAMDVEAVARSTGFQQRSQRKIAIRDLALGVMAVGATGRLSFERVAMSVARRARQPYSKQALHKRLDPAVSAFLLALFARCLQPAVREARTRGLFASFRRVLLHDSSTLRLPSRFAKHFPGSANQRKAFSQLKIQVVCDLLNDQVEHLSLSGFTRNDQRASPDILAFLRPGDLVIRDLGYFVLPVFAAIIERGAFFLSRYQHGRVLLDPCTQRPIPLGEVLKKQGFFDAHVLLGAEARVPVRVVAVPVPDAVANLRRRKLRQNRDQSLNPSKEHFFLLGWNIFITNVGAEIWPAQQLPIIYGLRWRIETLFKAWKSYLALTELNTRCLAMIHLSVVTKLLFCAFVYRTCRPIEITLGTAGRRVSLLRVAHILSALALCLEAAFVKLTPERLLVQLLDRHGFYERRPDRRSFPDMLHAVLSPLG